MSRQAINDLRPGTNYVIQVRAVSDDSASEWSRQFFITTMIDTIKPKIPANASWGFSGDSFHGEWDAVTQNVDGETIIIDRYDVELTAGSTVKTTSVPTSANRVIYDLSYEANRAVFGSVKGTISMRVRAVDSKGLVGDWTASMNAINTPPSPVTALSAVGITDGVALAWTAPGDTDLIGYNIYVNTVTGTNGTKINNKPLTDTNFNYGTTTYGLQYFRVTAVDKFGQESTAVEASATPKSPFTVDSQGPAVPTALAAPITVNANGIGESALVSWTHASPETDLAGFSIRFRRSGTSDNWTVVSAEKDDRAIRVDLPLAYTGYEFQIRAFDWTANYSAWSGLVTTAAPSNANPAAPATLTAVVAKDSIMFSWAGVADLDVADYELTVSTSATFAAGAGTQVYKAGTSTSLGVNGLTTGTQYYARVRTIDRQAAVSGYTTLTGQPVTTGTFPTTALSDGYAPQSSPTPSVSAGLGYLYATWAPVTLNSNGGVQVDPVTYEVHLSTTSNFTPSAATKVAEVTGTFALIDTLPGTTTGLAYNTTYYVRLIAKDRDNAAAVGTQASGTPLKAVIGDIDTASVTPAAIGAETPTGAQSKADTAAGTARTNAVSDIKTLWGASANNTLIDGGRIYTNSILAQSIALSDWNNYVANPGLEISAANWNLTANWIRSADATFRSGFGLQSQNVPVNGFPGVYQAGTIYGVKPGDSFYLECTTYSAVGVSNAPTLRVLFKDANGTTVAAGNLGTLSTATAGAYVSRNNSVVAPAGTNQMLVWIEHAGGASPGEGRIGDLVIRRRNGGELIVDGTVSATVLKAGTAITANLGVTGVLTVSSSGAVQSSNYNGTVGWQISATGAKFLDSGSTVAADAIKAGTLGGPSGSGIIDIAAGTALRLNGGYLKSNTYAKAGVPLTAYDPTATAGFYLGNDGLVIASGAVSASALTTGAITGTNTITLSGANAKIVGTGFELSGSGLNVSSGTIAASAITLTSAFSNSVGASMTTIDGGIIKTGTIRSTNDNTINGVTEPVWSIPLNGAATFSGMRVLGNTVLGNGTTDTASLLSSSNYSPGTTGWQLRADGTADLRGLAADSINGKSITTSSLSAAAIGNSLGADALSAVIQVNGTLQATGGMGESVQFGAEGFQVIGAHETPVVSRSVTANVATVNTSIPHGYAVGGKVTFSNVGGGLPDSQQFTILSVPSATSLTVAVTGQTDYTTTAVQGVAQGLDVTGTRTKPTYIDFPTDGAKPNIISGVLTASTMVVTNGATLRGVSGIEPGASLTIGFGVLPPKAAPGINVSYNAMSLSGIKNATTSSVALGGNGNLFVLSNGAYSGSSGTRWDVTELTVSTGAVVSASRATKGLSSDLAGAYEGLGIAYYNNKYYVLSRIGSRTGVFDYIYVYDTAWTELTNILVQDWTGQTVPKGTTLGFNHLTNRLIYAQTSDAGVVIREHGFDASGYPVAAAVAGTTVTLSGTGTYTDLAYVARGNFDYGSERIISKARTYSTTDAARQAYVVTTATGATSTSENWPVANASSVGAAYWSGSNFIDISTSKERRTYFGGNAAWLGALTQQAWVAYSWFDPSTLGTIPAGGTDATHETTLSPGTGITYPKRSQLSVTIAPVPKGTGDDTPTQAKVYQAISTTMPALTSNTWIYRTNISYPLTSGVIDPSSGLSGAPKITNEFGGSSNPGMIQSTTGKSFWKGDDTAQFYQLTLASDTDVNTTAGNLPPLRIGDTANVHMRLDGNEIQVMSGPSAAGELFLQAGGGQFKLGKNGSHLEAVMYGSGGYAINASGLFTINHSGGFGGTGYQMMVMPASHFGSPVVLHIYDKTSNTTVVQVSNASTGALITSQTRSFNWICIG